MGFEEDLKVGEKCEKCVKKLFESKGFQVDKNNCPTTYKEFDLYIGNVKKDDFYTIEIKADFASMYTNNVAIEQKSLENSKADYFIYIIPKVYMINTLRLRQLRENYKTVMGGDYNEPITLVPIKDFIKECKKL